MVAAIVAGAVLGWERESQQKPAGLRTHMLVSLGAAGFMIAGLQLHQQLFGIDQQASSDLMKVIAGIIGGIGFLGAGSIMRSGGEVQGLTTAATIWLAASIGLACGLGFYIQAATSVVLALVILFVLGVMERFLFAKPAPQANGNPPAAEGQTSKASQDR